MCHFRRAISGGQHSRSSEGVSNQEGGSLVVSAKVFGGRDEVINIGKE